MTLVVRLLACSMLSTTMLCSQAFSETTDLQTAQNIYRRLTGQQLPATDTRIMQMVAQIKNGDVKAAALIATQDPMFLSGTIVPLAAKLGSVDNSPNVAFNDFQAMFVGVTRDNLDARELLTGNYAYQFKSATPRTRINNTNYESYDGLTAKLSATELVKVSPQWPDQPERDVAGLLTTRGWAEAHYNAGTNRRALQQTFAQFLCSPIETWRDVTVSDQFVGRDVDRIPSGDPTTYQTTCRGCHGNMDGMRPAFGHMDFSNNRYAYLGSFQIANKFNQHSDVFPQGFAVVNDEWTNQTVESYDKVFGWRGPTSGSGLNEFGKMIAESQAYKKCFAKRAFAALCRRDNNSSENGMIEQLANDFEKDGYSVKSLFANTAAKANCF